MYMPAPCGRYNMRLAPPGESVIRTRPMRLLVLALTLILAGCSKPGWHMTDISGAMPALNFALARDGDIVETGKSYRGKVVALYFGYTHCPDVCPTTLANLTEMLGKVASPDVRVLFVTVDPDRDTA